MSESDLVYKGFRWVEFPVEERALGHFLHFPLDVTAWEEVTINKSVNFRWQILLQKKKKKRNETT